MQHQCESVQTNALQKCDPFSWNRILMQARPWPLGCNMGGKMIKMHRATIQKIGVVTETRVRRFPSRLSCPLHVVLRLGQWRKFFWGARQQHSSGTFRHQAQHERLRATFECQQAQQQCTSGNFERQEDGCGTSVALSSGKLLPRLFLCVFAYSVPWRPNAAPSLQRLQIRTGTFV